MRRRTTAQKLQQALSDRLLTIEKAEAYSKTSHEADEITADAFRDGLDFLCETVFAPCIGWRYEYDIKAGQYIAECGRMDGSVDVIVTVYMRVANGASDEAVEKELLFAED